MISPKLLEKIVTITNLYFQCFNVLCELLRKICTEICNGLTARVTLVNIDVLQEEKVNFNRTVAVRQTYFNFGNGQTRKIIALMLVVISQKSK